MPLRASGPAVISKEELQGVWKLIAFNFYAADDLNGKPIAQPLGPNPQGRVVFTPTYISAFVTSPEKPISGSSWGDAPTEEAARVAKAMNAYCGHYKIYTEGGETRLETSVEISLYPNWIGGSQIRRVSVSVRDGRTILTLRPVQQLVRPDGTKGEGVLDWVKME